VTIRPLDHFSKRLQVRDGGLFGGPCSHNSSLAARFSHHEAVRRRPDLRIIFISGFVDRVRLRWPLLRKPFRGSRLCDLVARERWGRNNAVARMSLKC
jgi:hypothetical protein